MIKIFNDQVFCWVWGFFPQSKQFGQIRVNCLNWRQTTSLVLYLHISEPPNKFLEEFKTSKIR